MLVAPNGDILVADEHPDPEPDQHSSGTSAAEGITVNAAANDYGAEAGPRAVKK
jgi:hypothetical protein